MLHPDIETRAEDYARQFASAEPFRHVVIEPFLDPAQCQQLMAEFPTFSARQALNEKGEVGGKAVNSNLAALGPAFARFDNLMQDPEFLALTSRITGIPNLRYDAEYVGGGTHENLHGQELDTHVDFNFHPREHTHRRLNLILFLNPEWNQEWGGCLELVRDPLAEDETPKAVMPLANRAVIFETTESSWHGFRRIRLPPEKNGLSRRSIAVYFYTREAPPRGAAPSHGTFYYQRPLPEHLRAGYTLDEEDVQQIRTLLTRRDHHIQFLYRREQEYSKVLSAVTLSPIFRCVTHIAAPARAVRAWFRRR